MIITHEERQYQCLLIDPDRRTHEPAEGSITATIYNQLIQAMHLAHGMLVELQYADDGASWSFYVEAMSCHQ